MQRLLHLNRGLPGSTVYDLSTVQQAEIRGEISPRIKCSSLRFKCNSLLYLNRGLPGSAVYDLSTDRQQYNARGKNQEERTLEIFGVLKRKKLPFAKPTNSNGLATKSSDSRG